jgi:ABC-type nitrate/sulfonate/bicarbonate transport system substrate-binding protein
VAIQTGLLAKAARDNGSTLEFQDFGSGTALTTALAAGDVTFMILPSQIVLALNAQNRGVLGLMIESLGAATVLIGQKKYESTRGTDVTKYDGARWSYTTEGSASQVQAKLVVKNAGLDWAKQKPVAAGSIQAEIPALQADRVDLVVMDPVSAAKAIETGIGYMILNLEENSKYYPYADMGTSLIARKAFVEQYPAFTAAIVAAELKGLRLLNDNINDPNKVLGLMPDDFKQVNSANWATEWKLVAPAFKGVSGLYSKIAIDQAVFVTRFQYGFPASTLLDTSALTNTYVTNAYKDLGLAVPKVQ